MKELELYVHIPFCIQKCAYCDFLSGPASEKEEIEYTEALLGEVDSYKETYKDRIVTSIFIGGGTPSVLPAEQMRRIIDRIKRVFHVDEKAEITMEMNPGTVSEEKFAAWKKMGISRLSIGLQSADDKELKILGRIHTYEEFLDCYRMARKTGFTNINVDLISAVPGQTIGSFEKTLHQIAVLAPEHISAYSLIIEEGTPFYDRYGQEEKNQKVEWKLPDEEEDRRIYRMTGEVLAQYGYDRYEISNYARSGYECRHNLGYWRRKDYLGIGTGAASLIDNVRFSHIADRKEYVKILSERRDPALIIEETELLDVKAQMEEFMFLGLRTMKGISKKEFADCFERNYSDIYGEVSRKLSREGLLCEEEDSVYLTDRGIDLSNQVFVEFLDPKE